MVKKELSRKVELSVYWFIYVPIFSCGVELSLVTKRMKIQMQTK